MQLLAATQSLCAAAAAAAAFPLATKLLELPIQPSPSEPNWQLALWLATQQIRLKLPRFAQKTLSCKLEQKSRANPLSLARLTSFLSTARLNTAQWQADWPQAWLASLALRRRRR